MLILGKNRKNRETQNHDSKLTILNLINKSPLYF